MGVCAKASDPNHIPRGTIDGGFLSPPSGKGCASGAALPTPSSLGPSLEAAASLSRVRAAATWAARAQGEIVLLLGYLGAGGAELVLCQPLEASVGVADGFQDPRATSVAVLSSWTWLAESHGVVTLGTPVSVPMRGQV